MHQPIQPTNRSLLLLKHAANGASRVNGLSTQPIVYICYSANDASTTNPARQCCTNHEASQLIVHQLPTKPASGASTTNPVSQWCSQWCTNHQTGQIIQLIVNQSSTKPVNGINQTSQ
jgi:hypothetical protein